MLAVVVLLSAIVPAALAQDSSDETNDELLYAPDRILVKLAPGAAPNAVLGAGSNPVFDRWRTVPVPPGKTPQEMVEELETSNGVDFAELDHVIQLDPQFDPVPFDHVSPVDVDDPFYDFQWHFPAVQLESAWAETTGTGVVVAVVDTGITQDGDDLDCHTFV
ncbi:MAG TPA: hypothetical protein VF115_07645, partial [Acidimicrobiia bacterium]